jgi:hypothetical protein
VTEQPSRFHATPAEIDAHLDATESAPGDPDRIVAYRVPHNVTVLLCRQHSHVVPGTTPVTAQELPEGGICTFGRFTSLECGRDVLAD